MTDFQSFMLFLSVVVLFLSVTVIVIGWVSVNHINAKYHYEEEDE